LAHAPATAPPWELALIPTPEAFATRGDWPVMLLVVEARSGAVRLAEPVEGPQGLKAAFTRAIKTPFEGLRPGRPRAVACPHGLLAVLQPALGALGLVCHGAHHLPAAEAATMSLLAEVASMALPARDIGWEGVARAMQRPIPWDRLGKGLGFHLISPDPFLDDLLVVVLGPPLTLPTLNLFQDTADWRAAWNDPLVDRSDVPIIEVRLKEAPRPTAELRAQLPRVGVHVDGHALTVQLICDGTSQAPPPEAQRRLAEACAAVLDLLSAPGGPPTVGAPPVGVPGRADLRVEALPLRPVTAPRAPAAARPAPAPTPAAAPRPASATPPPTAAPRVQEGLRLYNIVEYALFTELRMLDEPADDPDWVVLRARKPDTPVLVRALQGAVALRAQLRGLEGWELTALQPGGAGMLLGTIPLHSMPRTATEGTMTLLVAMGGAREQATAHRDRLWRTTLPLTVLSDDGSPFLPTLSVVDRYGLLRGASWKGSPAQWPELQPVLLAFLGPLMPPTAESRAALDLVTAASTIWEIHARLAEGADGWGLKAIVYKLLGPWLGDLMFERRARLFAHDVRHVQLAVLRSGTTETLRVSWEPVRSTPRPR
jgi:hypothetical protein